MIDKHNIAHYVIGAAAVALGGTAIILPHKPSLPIEVASSLTGALKPFAPHALAVYCIPSMCGVADEMADRFNAAGWASVSTSQAIDANAGVGVRASQAVCGAIREAVGEAKCDIVGEDEKWEVWIGKPERASSK